MLHRVQGFSQLTSLNLQSQPGQVATSQVITLRTGFATGEHVAGQQEPVFLRVQIGDENPLLVPTNVSPDSDYWWLDRVTRFPVRLTRGLYPLRYTYAGTEQDGLSKVDAFYLQPVKPQRVFQLLNALLISLTYDITAGEITWEESS